MNGVASQAFINCFDMLGHFLFTNYGDGLVEDRGVELWHSFIVVFL